MEQLSKCCNAEIHDYCNHCNNGICTECGELTNPTPPTSTEPQNFLELPEDRQREIIAKAVEDSTKMQQQLMAPTSTEVGEIVHKHRLDSIEAENNPKYEDGYRLRTQETEADHIATQAITRLIQQAELRGRIDELEYQCLGVTLDTTAKRLVRERISELQSQLEKGGQ